MATVRNISRCISQRAVYREMFSLQQTFFNQNNFLPTQAFMPWKDKSKYETEEYLEYKRNYQRAWHQRHKIKRIAKIHERRDKLREFYRQFKENSVCVQCGESHPATLHFHHRNPKEKDFNLAEITREGYGIERIKREIAKCVVLCANCHAKYHYDSNSRHLSTSNSLANQIRAVEQIISAGQKENFTEPLCDRYFPEGIDVM